MEQSQEQLLRLNDLEIISLLEEAIGPPNSYERYDSLRNRGERDLVLEIAAEDAEGNLSESDRLSLRIDINPPALDPLALPDECEPRESNGTFRKCETSRETLSLSLNGQSPISSAPT